MAHAEPARVVAPTGTPIASLDVVDIRPELDVRPRRAPSLSEEHRAFSVLASEMATNPRNMLQKLVELAVDLCDAHTAGISLLEGDVFRWEAVAGVFAAARGGTMPRDQSPCGVCIDRDATQLMHLADRRFPALLAEPRFVEALLIPFHANGKPIGTVWIVSHTEDRKFDQEDERIVRNLSQFASAGWQLLQVSEALAERNRRKDDFLATLGHELRNPLGAIVAASAVLQRHAAVDPAAMRALDIIGRQTRHMTRLTDDLLDVARVETGKLELARRTLDVRAVIAHTIDARRDQITRRQQSLTVELGDEPVFVDADPIRLAQVVSNLLDNAAKYTPEHGQISVALSSEGGEAVIVVRDSGIGIPSEKAQSVFEPFTQLEQSRQGSDGGLGLGLALVKRLTELHGGLVRVASDGPNQGSSFIVRLPIRSPGSADEQVAAGEVSGAERWPRANVDSVPTNGGAATVTPASARRVLIVEDSEDGAEMLSEFLRMQGYETRVAHNGVEGLKVAERFAPDIVFVDIGLPVMDGYELVAHLQQLPSLNGARLVALTGYGQESDRSKTTAAGFHAHLVKPIDFDALDQVLTHSA